MKTRLAYKIDIGVEESDNWYETEVEIFIEGLTDMVDVESEISEQAILWCSDNGHSYRTWEYVPK